MGRLFHNALTLVLVPAVLAGSLVPPAFCHAHTAGNRPHSHHSALCENSEHDEQRDHGHAHGPQVSAGHHHGSQHSHRDDCSDESPKHEESAHSSGDNKAERSAWHSHISFIGFSFSFPLPHGDESDDPLTPDERQLGIVRVTGDVIPVSRVDLVDVVDGTARWVDGDRVDAEMSRTAKPGVCAVDRVLLCDSARCERSGVLLI